MRVVSLGRTSIEISEFIFGAGAIGGVGSSPATRGQGITHEQGLDRLDEAEYGHPGTPARLTALREVAKDAGATVKIK